MNNVLVPDSCFFSSIDVFTVCLVALHASLLTSVANVRMSSLPNMCFELATANASTTPDPLPTSTTNGGAGPCDVEVDENLSESHAASETDDNVSKNR